jgi:CRP/FNR family transcriptional regulator, cyclic AMP receptor protein
VTTDLAAGFFDYDAVDLREDAGALAFLANRPRSDWNKLIAHTETRRFSQGEVIIAAGEVDRALYLLSVGTLGVRLARDDVGAFKAIDAPSIVGEVAFIDGLPRSATLIALTDGELLRLRMASFEVLAAREPELGRAILLDLGRIVSYRLRLASDVIARTGG